jgi:hypothetical protein
MVVLVALGLALFVRVVKQYQLGVLFGWAGRWGRGSRDCTASCR